ncbi:uncharacterized protein LOC133124391 isoform X6 [Conger conger]|uniref:uncharacterized protein LOC133124391 isoform X6 n=1 Tax=Conger conger TaxID=82655 RepID=UPI002A5A7618|nr:uncharacterized protein LOC133124391 isoform X6 [Conger conger]
MRCFYSLEERPSPFSDPSTVTVLDLKKPSISVSMKNNQAHIHCEAPPDITGAQFFLYLCSTLSETLVNSALAGKEERAAIFTVPHSSDSTLIYYCIYQLKRINSKLSDCAEVKNKDQSGGTEDQNWLKTPLGIGVIFIVVGILMGMAGVSLYWIHKKRKSNRVPTTPNTVPCATFDVSKGPGISNAIAPPEVTYSTVTHLPSPTSAFQPQQDNVVYSSLKTE